MFINQLEFLNELKTFDQLIPWIQELDWIAQCDPTVAAILHLITWVEEELGKDAVWEFLNLDKKDDITCLDFFAPYITHSLFSECTGIQFLSGEFAGIRYLAVKLCEDFSPEWIYSLDQERPMSKGEADLNGLLSAGKQECGYHESN